MNHFGSGSDDGHQWVKANNVGDPSVAVDAFSLHAFNIEVVRWLNANLT